MESKELIRLEPLRSISQARPERFPGLDPRRFGPVDLVALCEGRLAAIAKLTGCKEAL